MKDNSIKVTDLFFHQPPSSAFETTKKTFHLIQHQGKSYILHASMKKMIWEVSKNIFAEGRMNPSMSGNWWPLDGSRLAQLLLQSLPHSCDSPGRGLRGWVISLRIQPLSHRAKTPFIHCQQAHSYCHLCVCVWCSAIWYFLQTAAFVLIIIWHIM